MESFPITKDEIPTITNGHQRMLDLPFTSREFHLALKDLGNNKSPGSDGITKEFYLKFWDLLSEPFFNSISHSIKTGTLSPEQRSGIITLIPKKGGDRLDLGNWHPITLLNNDFKIYSKALSKRIQPYMKDIISEDQTCFIRGRTIGTNILNTQTIIQHSEITGDPGFLVAVDYAKAFDSIRWELIFKALELYGFGTFTLNAIKVLFSRNQNHNLQQRFLLGLFLSEPGDKARLLFITFLICNSCGTNGHHAA